jgi:hypothetical protein
MSTLPCRFVRPLSVLLLATLAGCGSLPDLRPLADATSELQSSTAMLGTEVATSLTGSCNVGGQNVECRKAFETAWAARVDALGAIAKYTDSLAQIAAAGEAGAESARQVGGAVNQLLGAIGQAPLSDAITSAAEKLYEQVANVRATNSMSDAVDEATPIVSRMVALLQADASDMAKIVQAAAMAASFEAEGQEQYNSITRAREVATAESKRLMASVADNYAALGRVSQDLASVRSNQEPTRNACQTESECTTKLHSLERALTADRQRLAELDGELERVNRSYAPLQDQLDGIKKRRSQQLVMLAQFNAGLAEWLAVHRTLGSDLRQSLQPNLRQLLQTAAEIQALVDEMRSTS